MKICDPVQPFYFFYSRMLGKLLDHRATSVAHTQHRKDDGIRHGSLDDHIHHSRKDDAGMGGHNRGAKC